MRTFIKRHDIDGSDSRFNGLSMLLSFFFFYVGQEFVSVRGSVLYCTALGSRSASYEEITEQSMSDVSSTKNIINLLRGILFNAIE